MPWLAALDAPTDDDLVKCVSCGLCLPACPTYRLTGRESASPRGRIAAMRLVAWGGAPIDDAFAEFMDFCLACRACETACPAGVPYGRLIEGARAQVEGGLPRPRRVRVLKWIGLDLVLPRQWLVMVATFGAWVAQRLHLPIRALGLLPRLRLRRSRLRTVAGSGEGSSALFAGCVQEAWFPEVNRASLGALVARGHRVDVPDGLTCCGALALHYGRPETARRLARRNVAALTATEGPIAVTSAGCGAVMKEWGHLLADDPAAAAVAARVRDITELLAEPPPSVHMSSASDTAQVHRTQRIAVHDPCHLAHAQRVVAAPRAMLRQIEGAQVVDVPDSTVCCGAAGLYNLLQPAAAGELGRKKAAAIASTGCDVVAVANPGCAMQIRRHLDDAGHRQIRVAHPVELL